MELVIRSAGLRETEDQFFLTAVPGAGRPRRIEEVREDARKVLRFLLQCIPCDTFGIVERAIAEYANEDSAYCSHDLDAAIERGEFDVGALPF
jgi:hypothetical protein